MDQVCSLIVFVVCMGSSYKVTKLHHKEFTGQEAKALITSFGEKSIKFLATIYYQSN